MYMYTQQLRRRHSIVCTVTYEPRFQPSLCTMASRMTFEGGAWEQGHVYTCTCTYIVNMYNIHVRVHVRVTVVAL